MEKETVIDAAEVEAFAKLMFSPKEICVIMEYDESLSKSDAFVLAFNKGKFLSEAAVRKSIFNLAANGSSPAQTLAMDLIEKGRLDGLGE